MAEMENKLNELNGKFKANLTKNKQYHQNMRDADAMCRDLERRCVQNHERSAQLTRFHNNPSNDFDVKVLAESITAKQNTRSRHGKQIFIIASNDTSFFSAYIDRNVVAHDTVTREIRKRYDIHCHAAQAACVILPRITGEEIDKGFDPDAFLDVLAIIRLELKTPGSSEYLKSRMDGVRAEPDVQRKRAMCRELLPYVDRYVQAL